MVHNPCLPFNFKRNYIFPILIFTVLSIATVQGQGYNTGLLMPKEKIVILGAEPYYNADSRNLSLVTHGGFKLTSSIMFAARVDFINRLYVNPYMKWRAAKRLSMSAGAHAENNLFGLDVSSIYAIPLGNNAYLNFGVDAEMNLPDNTIQVPLWVPIGVEVFLDHYISFLFEAQVGVTRYAPHLLMGGVVFYL